MIHIACHESAVSILGTGEESPEPCSLVHRFGGKTKRYQPEYWVSGNEIERISEKRRIGNITCQFEEKLQETAGIN